jgi:hypothetical protein
LEPPEHGVRVGEPVLEPREPPPPKPWQARFVAAFLLTGGMWAFVHVIVLSVKTGGVCCLWPGIILEVGWGVAALARGGILVAPRDRPRAPAVVVILQVLIGSGAFELVNTLLGVLNVLLVCAPASRRYYRNEWGEHD